MTAVSLFPFADYWWFYVAFTLFVLGMLALDLGVFHRRAHEVSTREALTWSVVWTSLALGFAAVLYAYCLWKFPLDARLSAVPGAGDGSLAWQTTLEFLTGFLIEKSLALDNIFVFVVIFQFFAIPAVYQHRILFFGILGALVFRVIFIALGAVLLQYKAVVIVFGVLLIATGAKILFAPVKPINPEANVVIRLLRRLLPVTPSTQRSELLSTNLGEPACNTPAGRPRVYRSLRHHLRGGFRAGDLRGYQRTTDRVHLERLCDSGNAGTLLPSGRCGAEVSPTQVRAWNDFGVRGPQDGLAERGLRREVPDQLVAGHHCFNPCYFPSPVTARFISRCISGSVRTLELNVG